MHFLLPRSSVPALCLMWRVGGESGGEAKLGAQGYNRKTRTGAKRDGEIGSSGVAYGEQRYLINTNARSKLFRHPSLTRLWNATDG